MAMRRLLRPALLAAAWLAGASAFASAFASAPAAPAALARVVPPPVDAAARPWQLRDAAEGVAYLARVLAEDTLAPDERAALSARLQATMDALLDRAADGAWWRPGRGAAGDPNLNRFVLVPLLDAARTLQAEGDFAERLHDRWLPALRRAVDLQVEVYRGLADWDWGAAAAYRYPNQDVLYAFACAVAARLFDDAGYAAEAERAIDSLERNQLPGGAFHYIAAENESPVYHALVQVVLARYVDITGDARALALLRRSAGYWHGVLSREGVAEGWSDVWWKQAWWPVPAQAVRLSAAVAGDAALAAVAQAMAARDPAPPRATLAEVFTRSWRHAPAPRPGPAQALSAERDLRTAHGRDGDWYYGATRGGGLRNTFVGGMLGAAGEAPLAASFRGAQIQVVDGDAARTTYWLSQREDPAVLRVDPERALLDVHYRLQPGRINGVPPPQDVDSPWAVRQLWSAGADGVMGSVELTALRDNAAREVVGRLPLGPCRVEPDGDAAWRCAGLRVRLFEAFGLPGVTAVGGAFASQVDRWDGLVWRQAVGGMRAGDRFRYVVWVGPAQVPAPRAITVTDGGGWVATWRDGRRLEVPRLAEPHDLAQARSPAPETPR